MPVSADCPDEATLSQLLLGNLPDEQMEIWGRHLLQCANCAARSEQLQPSDALTISLRNAATLATGSEDALAQQLRQRLHGLRAGQSKLSNEPTQDFAAPTEASALTACLTQSPATPSFGFLSPAQADGEIGRLGPYRVLKVLGQGGMGVVFQAEDPRLARICALKVMLPEVATRPGMRERFLREARAAAQIEHDNIIPIYQVDEEQGVPYIAMPFLKGLSLDDWIRKRLKDGPHAIRIKEILKVGRQIATGLAAAHQCGLIHRDIKPANVWLDASAGGRVKILDFGLARVSNIADQPSLTQSGAVMGTPSYMAPEQARGEHLDGRADLFSLGVILYRMCTGVLPFAGKDTLSTLMALATETPVPPHQRNPAIPPALSELVMNLLEKDPAQRTASAQEVVAAILAIERNLSTLPETAPSMALPGIDTRNQAAGVGANTAQSGKALPARKRRALLWAALSCGALLAAGLVLFWQTPHGTVRFEINDPQIKVLVDGHSATITKADARPIRLKPGMHGLTVSRGGFEFITTNFHLAPDGDTKLIVQWLPGQIQVLQDGKQIGQAAMKAAVPQVARDTAPAAKDATANAAVDSGMPAAAGPPPSRWPFDPQEAPALQEQWARYLEVPVEVENSLGMKFRLIPAGEFTMGTPPEELDEYLKIAQETNQPSYTFGFLKAEAQKHVVIDEPYYLSVHEVTQRVWQSVMGSNPSRNKTYEDLPVESVAWVEVATFCSRLSEREGRTASYRVKGEEVEYVGGNGYRLPLGSEWEFACRAGSATRYFFGTDPALLDEYAWYFNNSNIRTHPVGRKRPNPFGLYDMYGNVWERILHTTMLTNHRFVSARGGDYESRPPIGPRSAMLYTFGREDGPPRVGFRLLLPVDREKATPDASSHEPARKD